MGISLHHTEHETEIELNQGLVQERVWLHPPPTRVLRYRVWLSALALTVASICAGIAGAASGHPALERLPEISMPWLGPYLLLTTIALLAPSKLGHAVDLLLARWAPGSTAVTPAAAQRRSGSAPRRQARRRAANR